MPKDDELALMRIALERDKVPTRQIKELMSTLSERILQMHPRRLESILDKWERKKWWESGVSVRSGWLTPLGVISLQNLVNNTKENS